MIPLPLPHEAPLKYVRHTPDGFVVFTEAGRALLAQPRLAHAEANGFWIELMRASRAAEESDRAARGWNEWVAHPVGSGMFEVTHRGETCRFRPIVNGKRRGGPGRRARTGHVCTACRNESPEGTTMYVPDQSDKRRRVWGGVWSGHRLCQTCVRPELAAAVLGAALVGAGEEP